VTATKRKMSTQGIVVGPSPAERAERERGALVDDRVHTRG